MEKRIRVAWPGIEFRPDLFLFFSVSSVSLWLASRCGQQDFVEDVAAGLQVGIG